MGTGRRRVPSRPHTMGGRTWADPEYDGAGGARGVAGAPPNRFRRNPAHPRRRTRGACGQGRGARRPPRRRRAPLLFRECAEGDRAGGQVQVSWRCAAVGGPLPLAGERPSLFSQPLHVMSSSPRPLVSITIPTYNRADSYLRETIESALDQTYAPVDVMVADNASTDATPDLVRSFDDDRLRYERHEENIGPFRNWQFCLDAARGEFIYMLHDDDLVDPDFLATCVAALADEPDAGFVRTGLRTIDADGRVLQDFPNRIAGLQGEAYVDAWLRRRAYWYFSNTLIRTEALRDFKGAFTRYRHTSDCANFARLALAHRGADVETVKASCRLHDEKLTRAAEVSSWVQEYRALRDDVIRLAADEWQDRLRTGANDFFSEICYRHAERIPGRARQVLMMGRIYRTFEWSRIPPMLSRAFRRFLPSSLIRWIRARRVPPAAA